MSFGYGWSIRLEELAGIPDETLAASGAAEEVLDSIVDVSMLRTRRCRRAAHRIFGNNLSHDAIIMQRVGLRDRSSVVLASSSHDHAMNDHSLRRACVRRNRIASSNRETR
jgi:hypothetical protein